MNAVCITHQTMPYSLGDLAGVEELEGGQLGNDIQAVALVILLVLAHKLVRTSVVAKQAQIREPRKLE